MKKLVKIILILIITLFIGCDDLEQTVDYKLPYIEKLVVQGQFGIYSTNMAVSVTKTLPPLEKATLDKVTITDAECKVYFKDTVVDLVYSNASNYVSEGRLDLEEGVEYRLEVKWKDKIATATTTIPRLPKILTIKDTIHNYNYHSEKLFLLEIQSVDKGMVSVRSAEKYEDEIVLLNKIGSTYTISYFDYNRDGGPEVENTFVMKYYDIAYYPYYVTRYEGQSESGIFSGGGLNVEGNVEGENTFGLWIGYNSITDTVDKYIVK